MITNQTTTERLNTMLEAVEQPLRDELFNQFHLLNLLEFAKVLHAISLPNSVKASLLALKVGQPVPYKGVEIGPLIERAMQNLWSRLGEER